MTTPRPSPAAYLALAAVCVIWGTTYLGLRIGVTQFPPFLFSFLRFASAGSILVGVMTLVAKVPLPDREIMINQSLCGLMMVTLGISIVGWAEVYISSGLAAIICSCMPIWALLINVVITKDEQPNWIILLGLSAGITGIVIIFGEHLTEFTQQNYTAAIVATFLANISWAAGSIWIKKRGGRGNPFLNAGIQMLAGAIFLIPLTLLFDDYSEIRWSGSLVATLAYMSLVGSVAAYACYSYAIKKLPMTIVSLYAYINPVVAVILGWLILNEKFNPLMGIAIVITLLGIYLVNVGYQSKSRRSPS